MYHFGTRLNKLRKAKKVTQTELAIATGLNRCTIGKYERGESIPKTDAMKAMATYFDVSVAELLDDNTIKTDLQENDLSPRIIACVELLKKFNEEQLKVVMAILIASIHELENMVREFNIIKMTQKRF